MVTPYAVSRYVLDHLPPFGGRATLKLYRAATCFILIKIRAKLSAPTPARSTLRRDAAWIGLSP
jgi:hypothetical protein